MKDFLTKHPDLEDILTRLPQMHLYKREDAEGNLKEMWIRDENGHWKDITAIEIQRRKIEALQQELIKLNKEIAKTYIKVIPIGDDHYKDKQGYTYCPDPFGIFVNLTTGDEFVEAKRHAVTNQITHLKPYVEDEQDD